MQAEGLLVAIAQRRDREAFAVLFGYYAPRIKTYLAGLGARPGTAEELAQEVMLGVWRKAAQFDPGRGTAAAWIFGASRNAYVSVLRRERRAEVEPADPALVPCETGAEDQMVALADQRALAEAIGALPVEQAEALRAAYLRGRTLSQIATELQIPLGTVKTRVRLGLERLRRIVRAPKGGST